MKSSSSGVLLLTRREVAALLPPEAALAAVGEAFHLHAAGRTLPPGVLSIPAMDGGFHLKAAGLRAARNYFAVKCNANFPLNPQRHGLPRIQGLVPLAEATNGQPLAVLDSMEITALRTAAATALAAKHLARPGSRCLFLAGCGLQGRSHLRALAGGLIGREDVRDELACLVARRIRGHRARDEIVIFDSTGIALEDVAAAVAVYEAALRKLGARRINFAA